MGALPKTLPIDPPKHGGIFCIRLNERLLLLLRGYTRSPALPNEFGKLGAGDFAVRSHSRLNKFDKHFLPPSTSSDVTHVAKSKVTCGTTAGKDSIVQSVWFS